MRRAGTHHGVGLVVGGVGALWWSALDFAGGLPLLHSLSGRCRTAHVVDQAPGVATLPGTRVYSRCLQIFYLLLSSTTLFATCMLSFPKSIGLPAYGLSSVAATTATAQRTLHPGMSQLSSSCRRYSVLTRQRSRFSETAETICYDRYLDHDLSQSRARSKL